MTDIKTLTEKIKKFRDDRDWKQFDNPKDMAISLTLEVAEVLEHFQWKSKEELDVYLRLHKEEVADELADVLHWILLISHDLGIDIGSALIKKLKKNEEKYPIEKSKGRHTKYNKL